MFIQKEFHNGDVRLVTFLFCEGTVIYSVIFMVLLLALLFMCFSKKTLKPRLFLRIENREDVPEGFREGELLPKKKTKKRNRVPLCNSDIHYDIIPLLSFHRFLANQENPEGCWRDFPG